MMSNKEAYTDDFTRISFVLSYMVGVEAESWKGQLLEEKFGQTDPDFGSFRREAFVQ